MRFRGLLLILLITIFMTLSPLVSGEAIGSAESVNARPIADAGQDQTARVGEVVSLNGSGSSDQDGDRLCYRWSIVSRPTGSWAVIWNSLDVNARFFPDRVGQYLVQLVVNDGHLDSLVATITITVEPCNSPPHADAGPDQTVTVGSTVQLDGTGSSDPDNDSLDFFWLMLLRPYQSSARLLHRFSPHPTFVADREGIYIIALAVSDGHLFDLPDLVRITAVASSNTPPVASDDHGATLEDAPVTINAIENDNDADSDPLTIVGVTTPSNGAASVAANQISYVPNLNFSGTDQFEYTISDGRGGVDTATVTVSVMPANDAPDATNDVASTDESVAVDIPVLENDTDVDGNALFISAVTQPTNGSVVINGSSLTYTPKPGFSGQDSFTYTASDGLASDMATVVVNVNELNHAPTANAGPDQTATVGSTIQLDGSASSDPDGDALSFRWSIESKPAGSSASLSDVTVVTPTFALDEPGTYVVQLIVNDGQADSLADAVEISTVNSPPVANAGPDQTALVTSSVTLDGSGSTDVDGDALTFDWSIVSLPAGSAAALSDPTVVNPSLTLDRAGDYVVQLTVNDGSVDSAPDTVTISTQNSTPVANAGPDQSAFVGDTAALDGSSSSDVDGDQLTFRWSFVSKPPGSSATLSDPAAVMPTFSVDQHGTYVIQLIVNDGHVDSAPDTVMVTTENRPPVANAGPDQTVILGAPARLDGTSSTDPDGDPITYSWSLVSVPTGSATFLSNPTAPTPTFVTDLAGSYTLQLIVNDGAADSAPDTVVISTENSAPIANAGPDQTVASGDSLQLDGSSSSDPDGTPLQFSWSLTTRPQGSTAILSDPAIVNPTFTADIPGMYVAQLIVSDGSLSSSPDTVVITATGSASVNVVATDGNAAEAGSDMATFVFSRTGDTGSPLAVTYTAGGTATNGSDYATISGSITIPAGASSAILTITPIDDSLAEGDETVVLTLVDAAEYDLGSPSAASAIIGDDDQPVVTIQATDASAAESGPDPGAFSISRSGPTTDPLVVSFSIDGTARNLLDYQSISASITIPAGSAEGVVVITPIADSIVEGDETVVLTLSPGGAYVVGTPDAATVTIADSPLPVVTIAATDSTAAESGLDPGTFTVSRTGPTTNPLTVSYAISGTATSGDDYEPIATSVTIPAGAGSATITVTPIDDGTFEALEFVVLALTSGPEYTIGGSGLATVSISDNDARVTVVATDSAATENSSDTGTFTITRSGPTVDPLMVFYSVSGTAINGTDYVALTGSVTIPSGAASTTVTVIPIDDALFEGPETVTLSLSPDANYTIGLPSAGTVTLTDDERPTVTLVATDDLGAEPGTDTAAFTVTRIGPTAAPLTVNYSASGSATNGVDYQLLPGSIIIPAGSSSAIVTITPIDDNLVEGAESVVLSLNSSPDYAVGVPGIDLASIADDDLSHITVVATDPVATEAGLTTGTFTIARTGDTSSALLVSLTRNGTASTGGGAPDYSGVGQTVTIPAGEASTTLTVVPLADNLVEGDETVVVTINPSLSYVAGTPNSATVTIVDDPPVVSVTATDPDASELGLDPGVFTFTRSGGNVAAALTVRLTRTGTAINGGDYTASSGNVTIPANLTSATQIVSPLADNVVENPETVILAIDPSAGGTGYVVGSPDSATVTIVDDPAVVSVVETDPDAAETGPDPGVVTFTRSGGNLAAALQIFVSRSGTASNGGDYVSLGGSTFFVTIPSNETSASVMVTPITDNLAEGPETVVLTVQPSSSYLVGTQGIGTVTIEDDPPVVSVTATDPDASESGSEPGVFTFTRTGGNIAAALTVNFSRGGTALNVNDYANIGFNVTIPANQLSVTVVILPVDDTAVEGPETVILTINPGSSYLVGSSSTATVTIADND